MSGNQFQYYTPAGMVRVASQNVGTSSFSVVAGGEFQWFADAANIMNLQNNPIAGTFLQVSTITNGSFSTRALGSGAWLPGFFVFSDALSGVQTGGPNALGVISTTSDNMQASGAGLSGFEVLLNCGGSAMTGSRIGINNTVNLSGAPNSRSAGGNGYFAAIYNYGNFGGNLGGVNGAPFGQGWGGVISGVLTSTASWWSNICGLEVDFGNQGASSTPYVQGMKLVSQNGTNQTFQASDYFLGMCGNATGTLFGAGISFGSPDGFWAWGTGSTLITAGILPNGSLPGYPGPLRVANLGVDFSAVTFSSGAFKSTGFLVDGSGNLTATKVTSTSDYFVTSTDYVQISSQNGVALLLHYPAGATCYPEFDCATPGTVGLSTIGATNANITITPAGTGVVSVNGPLTIGSTSGPVISSGTGAPGSSTPGYATSGSIFIRTNGSSGARVYVSAGSSWVAISGV